MSTPESTQQELQQVVGDTPTSKTASTSSPTPTSELDQMVQSIERDFANVESVGYVSQISWHRNFPFRSGKDPLADDLFLLSSSDALEREAALRRIVNFTTKGGC